MTPYGIDPKTTADIIEQMSRAGVGSRKKWRILSHKISDGRGLDESEVGYVATFARIYGRTRPPSRRILHVRLSEEDRKPACQMCGRESQFYCNQNDAYFCSTHIVGHDSNEA